MPGGSHPQKLTVATGSHTWGGGGGAGKGPRACAAPAWKCWVCTVLSAAVSYWAAVLPLSDWMVLKRGVWVISWFTCLVRQKRLPQCGT